MKDITIQEGEATYPFSSRKLRTNLQGTGNKTCDWVPEDEVKTKTLRIDENGTWDAFYDGIYAYDEVIVTGRFEKDIYVNLNVDENDSYSAEEYGAYGFYDVLVNVPDPNSNVGASVEGYDEGGNRVRVYVDEDGAISYEQEN